MTRIRKLAERLLPINFAPLIRAPKLMLHGRYDEVALLKLEAEPLYKLLREPKRFKIFEMDYS